jgi:hypothetical protein
MDWPIAWQDMPVIKIFCWRGFPMTETKPKKNPAQKLFPEAKSLKALIHPLIEEMLIDRFFQGDSESYFLFLDILESAQTWTEAVELIDEEAIRRDIHPMTLPAMKFKRLIKRKFGVYSFRDKLMPIYEYFCPRCGHLFEKFQSIRNVLEGGN